jgi:hypothetical protein
MSVSIQRWWADLASTMIAVMGAKIVGVTAKELLLQEAPRWSEQDAEVALRAVDREHASDQQRREIDAAIIESYTRIPQEDLGASWVARQSIREEP